MPKLTLDDSKVWLIEVTYQGETRQFTLRKDQIQSNTLDFNW